MAPGKPTDLLDDYAGPFDPDFELARLTRPALGRLGREGMLFAHLHDRALMPLVGRRFGAAAMTEVACDEWMGASPIYNRRLRSMLAIPGDGVPAILKTLQLDVGFPHEYMDVGYELVDESEGFFFLRFCGAYRDVFRLSRGSEKAILQLCHDMEDTTFDATVMAVNPRARCRPVHRPPLGPGHRGPACRWRVFLADAGGTPQEHPLVREIGASRAGRFGFGPVEADPDGLDDYSGPFRPDFALEDLSRPVLARQCAEFALDTHLLMRAAYASVRSRWGEEAARELAREEWSAVAPVAVARVRRALGIDGEDLDSILKTLQIDPAFPPGYLRIGCQRPDASSARFWIEDCEALAEGEPEAWLALLLDAENPGLDAVVTAVNPRARLRPLPPESVDAGPARLAWEIRIDAEAEPRPESPLTALVRSSNASGFAFRTHGGERA